MISMSWPGVRLLTACLPFFLVVPPSSAEYIALRERALDGLTKRSTADLYELLLPKYTATYYEGIGMAKGLVASERDKGMRERIL